MTRIRRRVTRTRRYAVGVVAVVAALSVVAGPVEPAGAAVTTFTMAPAAGPPGTVVHVRGRGCAPGVIGSSRSNYVAVTATTLDVAFRAPVKADGSWKGTFAVPASGPGAFGPAAPVTAACISTGVVSLTTIYTPQAFAVTAVSPPSTGGPPTTGKPSDGTVVIPGHTTTVISVPPSSGRGASGGVAAQGDAQPGAGRADGKAKRDATANAPEPATLQPVGIDARSAAGTGGAGLGWLGWMLLLVLLVAALGASGYAWHARRLPAGVEGGSS